MTSVSESIMPVRIAASPRLADEKLSTIRTCVVGTFDRPVITNSSFVRDDMVASKNLCKFRNVGSNVEFSTDFLSSSSS